MFCKELLLLNAQQIWTNVAVYVFVLHILLAFPSGLLSLATMAWTGSSCKLVLIVSSFLVSFLLYSVK